jgi:uncharacterized protein YidB (DUF937 family)
MGLLDGILGNVLGSLVGGGNTGGNTQSGQPGQHGQQGQGGGSAITPMLLMLVLQLVQKSGGLTAILDRLRKSGLNQQADSWVSTGNNLPVSGQQISQALGPGMMDQLGAQTGLDSSQLGDALAQLLPTLVNQMTPDGQVPSDHEQVISDGLAALARGNA